MIQIGNDRLWSEAELLERLRAGIDSQPSSGPIRDYFLALVADMIYRDIDFLRGALRGGKEGLR